MPQGKHYSEAKITKLPDSEVAIAVVVAPNLVAPYRTQALHHLREGTALPGFRKGKVPESMLLEKIGETGVWEEAAQLLVKDAYREILANHSLDVIGQPNVSVTKLAPGNPLEFTITAALFPEFALPDYHAIAHNIRKNAEAPSVSPQDIEDVIAEIQKIRTPKGNGGQDTLPEWTDDFVKTLGNFENVADLKKKVGENLGKEKELRAQEKTRLEIMNEIIKQSDIPVPEVLIESELDRMIKQFYDDLKRMNQTPTEHLKKINKTEAELRAVWRTDARRRVQFELVLEKVAQAEKITANEDDVNKETAHIVEHHSGADPKHVRPYVAHQLRNDAVFRFLETEPQKK